MLNSNSPFIVPSSVDRNTKEWGTFRDSLRSPIHSWFTYPAGFSHKAVEHSIEREGLIPGKSIIYDPFMGSGTTNIVAKYLGINSVGVEAHPFVYEITLSKIFWDLNFQEIDIFLSKHCPAFEKLPSVEIMNDSNQSLFPNLVLKCFLTESLFTLRRIRDAVNTDKTLSPESKRFLRTSLICTLRDVSIASTGWPYIAPNKIKITSMSKNAIETFLKRTLKMMEDVRITLSQSSKIRSNHDLILGTSALTNIQSETVDHIFTSPPYLNNFDYADRTRLEMYFMGDANSWGDITKKIRTKLMTSATTQISRNDKRYVLKSDIQKISPEIYDFISESKFKLEQLRKVKGGKKSYDLMISGYFNDIHEILKDNYRVLKPGSKALYILGDSAPYGVHIPTDEIIGKMGVALGFKSYDIELLRVRGGKWPSNPQRHSVPLRETIVTLKK